MAEKSTSDRNQPAPLEWGAYDVPALAGVHGTIEFRGPNACACVTIDDGRITLSPTTEAPADCVIESEIDGELLGLVRGESNLVTALLQGRIEASGNPMLVTKIAGSMPQFARQMQQRQPGGR